VIVEASHAGKRPSPPEIPDLGEAMNSPRERKRREGARPLARGIHSQGQWHSPTLLR